MADGPGDELDEESPEEGRVLSPEELDISESEHVEQLDEGRFVVSPDGPPNVPSQHRQSGSGTQPDSRSRSSRSGQSPQDSDDTEQSQSAPERQASTPSGGGGPDRQSPNTGGELTEEVVHRWLRRSFEGSSSRYAFDVTATFDGQVSQRRMASNDVVTIFESLVLWYAQQVDSDTPVEEILGILLMESNVPIRYPPESIHRLIKSEGLGPDDTIEDLLEAVGDDGLQL